MVGWTPITYKAFRIKTSLSPFLIIIIWVIVFVGYVGVGSACANWIVKIDELEYLNLQQKYLENYRYKLGIKWNPFT